MDVAFVFVLLCTALLSVASSPALILTPYVKRNQTLEARNLSKVNSSLFFNITSHSGFLTVNETYNSNLFFWYFPLENRPWIIWLQGGPAASSLAGLFQEIGPFEYDTQRSKLKQRKFSWVDNYGVLFIDNPIGAGYSFTNSVHGFARDMETYTNHLYSALQQFLKIFPEQRKLPLFVAGESYAGRYVPALAAKIAENQDSDRIQLEGLIMGNPVFDRRSIADYPSVYYHWGLIDSQGLQATKTLERAYLQALQDKNADLTFEFRNDLLNKLEDLTFQHQMYNILKDYNDLSSFMAFLQKPEVSEAIHVGRMPFTFINRTTSRLMISDVLSDIVPVVEHLLDRYRLLIYCGQLDLTAACVPSAQARRNWRWAHRDLYLRAPRVPWWYNNTVAGYVKSGGYLTEALIRGAGHLVPMDKPSELLTLVTTFIKGHDIQVPTNYKPDPVPPYEDLTVKPTIVVVDKNAAVKTAMTISLVLNVMLVLGIVVGVVYCVRWKRRNESFFYSSVEDTFTDGVLSMT